MDSWRFRRQISSFTTGPGSPDTTANSIPSRRRRRSTWTRVWRRFREACSSCAFRTSSAFARAICVIWRSAWLNDRSSSLIASKYELDEILKLPITHANYPRRNLQKRNPPVAMALVDWPAGRKSAALGRYRMVWPVGLLDWNVNHKKRRRISEENENGQLHACGGKTSHVSVGFSTISSHLLDIREVTITLFRMSPQC